MTHTEQTILETLTGMGLAGSLIASQAHLDDTITFRWAGDGPRPGLASLLFAAVGADVTVTTTGDGLAVTVAGWQELPPPQGQTPAPSGAGSAHPPQAVPSPLLIDAAQLWGRYDLDGVRTFSVGLIFDQVGRAIEAGDYGTVCDLAAMAEMVAKGRLDWQGVAAAQFAVGVMGNADALAGARAVLRREIDPRSSYNLALVTFALALTSDSRPAALDALEDARDALDRLAGDRRDRVQALAGQIRLAMGQAVPVVYVPG